MSKPPKVAPIDGAPFIPVDFVISGGAINGIVQVTLGAQDWRHNADAKLEPVMVPTAHLRMTPQMTRDLIAALQHALDGWQELVKTPPSASKN
jgi:hypothetical protein